MMWVCPSCWETFSIQRTCCPKCGFDVAAGRPASATPREPALDRPDLSAGGRAAAAEVATHAKAS